MRRPAGLLKLTRLESAPRGLRRGMCWIWLGRVDRVRRGRSGRGDGYGRFGRERAHRAVYTLMVGPIPRHLDLDHLCSRRLCVSPRHLEPVTHQENQKRRGERAK